MTNSPIIGSAVLTPDQTLLEYLQANKLPTEFYGQPTLDIARQLLGKALISLVDGRLAAGLIVETEGYIATIDPACHAYTGLTRRNAVMWGVPGRAYVYFTYGNHWMINVVTEEEGLAAAVLIRALEPIAGLEDMRRRRGLHRLKGKAEDRQLTNGPGKLCQALAIDGTLNNSDLAGDSIFIAAVPPNLQLPPFEVVETTRIGITRGVDFPWRYYVKGNRFVSKW